MSTLQSFSRIFSFHKAHFLSISLAHSFASIPKKSASLIIARQNGSNKGNLFDYDVFFLKRPSTGSFSGVHAFPGGQLSDEDSHYPSEQPSGGLADNNSQFLNCALRETFEETGFFFTKHQISHDDAKNTARQLLWDDHICFYELSSYLPAEFSNDKILPFLRLITVPAVKTRYDCYFYLLAASELNTLNWNKFIKTKEDKFLRDTEDILINQDESVAYEWMNPLKCLERSFKGEIQLAPPQFMLLNIMSSFFKLEDFTKFLSSQNVPSANSDIKSEDGDILSSDPYFFPYLIGLQNTSKINPQLSKQYPFTALMGGDVKYQLKKILEQEEDIQLKTELSDKVGGLKLTEQSRNRVYFKDPKRLFGDEYEVEINCSQRSPFVHLKSYQQLKDLIALNQ